jgi:hypothetical protein
MPLDFSALGTGDSVNSVLHPREIFAVLQKDPKRYQYPRDVQAEVWDRWFEKKDTNDIVLKMNTGGGKTVVGLLILKSCLNERKGPAVYVAPDPYLVGQVLAEAKALGLDATDDADDPRFLRGQSILVVNVFKLINGRSVFGVGDGGMKIPLGSIVVDDAHACLASTEGQFTLRVQAPSALYERIFAAFKEDLRAQSVTGVLDVAAHDPNKEMLIPYWAWQARVDEVAKWLHEERLTDEIKFEWPLLKEVLPLCECVIGGGAIEIAPRCLPIDAIPSFTSAKRRVFMTATLADDSVLVTHFDVDSAAASNPVTPSRADDVGDRLILIPQELNPETDEDQLREFVAEYAKVINVVVIVPSHARAALWKDAANQVLNADRLDSGIAKLKKGHVGLTVIINKYDGIDLPDDACRMLVLDGLPDIRTKLDRVDQAVLYGSSQQAMSMLQKIEQGMGRGVRSNADYCIVVLMGRTLTRQVNSMDALSFFTLTTRAQFSLSEKVAEQLRGKGVRELRSAIKTVLKRDRGWVDVSRGSLVGAKYEQRGNVNPVAAAQRGAFNAARGRDYSEAVKQIQSVANAEKDPRVRGWLKQQLAQYENFIRPVDSQKILQSAFADNKLVTRPLAGISYERLSSVARDQAPAAVEYLSREFPSGNHLAVELYSLLDDLKFEPDTAVRFEIAVATVARLIGFVSQRPEAEYGRGPDVLWSLGSSKFLVIEAKNGVSTDTIAKSDCDQLSGSVNWFRESYDQSASAAPLMIHPVALTDRACAPPKGMRVMNTQGLEVLKSALQGFVLALSQGSWPPKASEVAAQLSHYSLTPSGLLAKYTVGVKQRK